jgi:hypothetical protein
MPAQKIVDLSDVIGPPKKVRFHEDGEVFKVPSDIPAGLYLRLTSMGDEELDDDLAAREVYDEVLRLFQVHQPDLEELPISLGQLLVVIPRIYGGEPADEEGGDRPSKGGTRSTSRRKPKRSRGSRS